MMMITSLLLALAFVPGAAAFDLPVVTVPAGVMLEPPLPEETPFECRPEIIAAFKEAWKRSGSGKEDYEAAFRVDHGENGDRIEFMPMTFEPYQLPVQYYPSRTAAIVHTHPDSAERTPGPGDYAAKVPNFVLSRSALYATIPGTKRHRFVRGDWRKPCA